MLMAYNTMNNMRLGIDSLPPLTGLNGWALFNRLNAGFHRLPVCRGCAALHRLPVVCRP